MQGMLQDTRYITRCSTVNHVMSVRIMPCHVMSCNVSRTYHVPHILLLIFPVESQRRLWALCEVEQRAHIQVLFVIERVGKTQLVLPCLGGGRS